MRYNSFQEAFEIAQEAHKGQVDLSNRPYINHPIVVSTMVDGYKAKIVAILHDVLEDSNLSLDKLSGKFSRDILEAIDLLTKRPNQDYFDYIRKLASNELARTVKIADLKHNMDITRLKCLGERDFDRLDKYHRAYYILTHYEQE